VLAHCSTEGAAVEGGEGVPGINQHHDAEQIGIEVGARDLRRRCPETSTPSCKRTKARPISAIAIARDTAWSGRTTHRRRR
jgi:hypothetical protein